MTDSERTALPSTTAWLRAGVAALFLLCAGPLAAQGTGAGAIPGGATAFVNATVLPMDAPRVLEGQVVVVRDGRIERVAPASTIELPPDVVQIDATGKYLMPGLAEMHAHIPGGEAAPQWVEDLLFLYVAHGVTTIRGMLGAPSQFELRERVRTGELLGPTIYLGAPSVNGNSAPNPVTGRELVRRYADEGWDFLKIHPGPDRATYDAIVAAARDAGITWAGHVPRNVGIRHALESGQSTIDHLDGYVEGAVPEPLRGRWLDGAASLAELVPAVSPALLTELATATAEAGVWNVPTEYLWQNFYTTRAPESFAALPEMRYVPRAMVQGWINQKRNMAAAQQRDGLTPELGRGIVAARAELLRALERADAPLLFGTDSPQMFNVPGFSVHREIAALAEIGLRPFTILSSATRNVGRYAAGALGEEEPFGTLTPGARADLILLNSNPLEDAARVADRAGVMVRGRWIPEAEIQRGLARIAERYAG